MTYNYIEETADAVRTYIEDNQINTQDFADRDEMYEKIYDDCWIEDSVTGNGSGSFTFNREKARECVRGNEELLAEALDEFEGDYRRALIEPEYADVTIRCYVLGQVVSIVLKSYKDEDFSQEDE